MADDNGTTAQPEVAAADVGEKQPGPLKSFFAGGGGGICLVVVGHPLDTIKVSVVGRCVERFYLANNCNTTLELSLSPAALFCCLQLLSFADSIPMACFYISIHVVFNTIPFLCVYQVKLQTMTVEPGKPPPYTGVMDVARKTIAEHGPRGLYAGVMAPLAGQWMTSQSATRTFRVAHTGSRIDIKNTCSLR